MLIIRLMPFNCSHRNEIKNEKRIEKENEEEEEKEEEINK
jgi:hypothetical protein